MTSLTNRGIPLSLINPRYLHSNSTSHTWPFSAVAELIDNAYDPDVSAKQLWINKMVFKQTDCLIFMDNGQGMNYDKMHKMLSFGFSDKESVKGRAAVGLYGNGFKSGSMRLGKDAIVFSKQANTMCVGLLSQTYLERTGAKNVVVPIVMFTKTGQTVSAAPQHAESLRDILKHSLFNTEEELLSEFSIIERLSNSSGTRIIIWNLRTKSSGELEFDFMKDPKDIRILDDVYKTFRESNKRQGQESKSVPESDYSLRAYCSILYLNPRMEIILQGQKVETQSITTTLAKARTDIYKPDCLKKGLTITFGYNKKRMEHYGLMMYHQNRLIKAYVRVPCQRKNNNTGQGVIGVIECNHLKPTHNKQDFDDTQEYRNTMKNLNNKLEQYWRNFSYSYQAFKPAENTESSTDEKPEDSIVELPAYKQHEKNLKLQLQKKNREWQSPSKARSSTQTTPSSLIFQSLTGAGSSSSDDTLSDTQEISVSTTPRKKRVMGQSQENTEKKKAKQIDFANNIPDPSTSTDLPAMFIHDGNVNKVGEKNIKTKLKDSRGDMIDKSREKKEQYNHSTQASSEHQPNYEVQLLQAKQEINQLQLKVKCLEDENCTLTSCYESLKKDLEETKKKSEKVKISVEDRLMQTDFPISSAEGCGATSAESSNSGRVRDSHFGTQQHQTQDRLESMQGNSDTQIYRLRLRELRQSVACLLVSLVPDLNLQQMNYDCEDVDEILTQVINKI
ncbi:MORC family CW-type zinc finger protein 3-like isoform X2 [Hemibagrus wyckioides]|uniref:MORC family CW-type zinc finger protein 3-like isoform X2 n=1 Tax=Hemibagrus wyckioides TaxID=337641 RepID=UPI00266C234C|nr:MORC family CW-type zinc finger protein 3-like isoform X2 [Hemibagrus wyckioides]